MTWPVYCSGVPSAVSVVEGGVEIGHGLLLLLEIERNHPVLARQHPAAA